MEFDGLPVGTFQRGVLGGFIAAMLFFALVCLLRALTRIRATGLGNYLKSAFRIHDDSLGLFLVLLVLLFVTILFFRRE